MPRGRPRTVVDPTKFMKPMSEQDRVVTRAELAQAEAQLKPSHPDAGGEFYTPPPQDVSAIKAQIDKKKLILQRDEDQWARGSEKDRLMARKKEIEGMLRSHKPTQREMSQMPTGQNSSQFARAVQHNVQYQEKYQRLEHELQDINVRLEPHDPNAHNLEYLRSDIDNSAVTI